MRETEEFLLLDEIIMKTQRLKKSRSSFMKGTKPLNTIENKRFERFSFSLKKMRLKQH